MMQRDYTFYIETAKQKQGYQFDNQVDMALGFKGSMTTYLKQSKRHLSDEKMIELAKLAGINPAIALIDLNILKTTGEAQQAYASLLQQVRHTGSDTIYYVK